MGKKRKGKRSRPVNFYAQFRPRKKTNERALIDARVYNNNTSASGNSRLVELLVSG